MARNSILVVVASATCIGAVCVCAMIAAGSPPKKKSASDSPPRAVADLKKFPGEIRAKPAAHGSTLALSEVVDFGKGAPIIGYTVWRKVYTISNGQKAPFKDMTMALDIPDFVIASCCPPIPWPPAFNGGNVELETWEFEPPAAKDTIYLVTAFATLTLSNEDKAICRFDPIIIMDGKAVAPALALPPGSTERLR